MIKQLSFLFLISSSFSAYSQFNETIRSGRPGQSIGPFTVGKSILQIQSGVDYFHYKNDADQFKGGGFLSNNVIRFGLTETFEISTQLEYKIEEVTSSDVKTRLNGLSAVDIGMRYHIYSGKGLAPSVGFQIRWRLPRVNGDYEIDQWAPRFIVVTNQSLSEKLSLTTNWGASWNGNDGTPTGHYTINLFYSISDQFGAFIENYGSVIKSDFNTYLDGGFAYLVTNDLQLDLLAGYGSNNGLKEYFISAGISARTKRK